METSPTAPKARFEVGTPQHFGWLLGIVKCVLVLNLLDAIFTLLWVRAGLALEANLFIDKLVDGNAFAFVAVKLGLVGLGSWLLWQYRTRATAVVAIFLAFGVYYLMLLYHLHYASHIVRQLIAADGR